MIVFKRSMSKKEVAQRLGISPSTLQRYLNKRYFGELEALDYRKSDRLLNPCILNYLYDKINLTP